MSDTEQKDREEEPKIVVDSDWKEQVAREKELAGESAEVAGSEQGGGEPEPSEQERTDETVVLDADEANASEGDGELPPPPPASFDVLVSMMFTQAMAFLGQVPDPASGSSTVNKPYAKHYIDTLEMLGEKTEGNLKDEEKKMLSEALHALRMMYVNVN